MAGMTKSESEFREQPKDITECCMCSRTYKDPRILPCAHTFCLKCLEEAGAKASNGPGDQMPCTVCGKDFTIPEKGHAALPRNLSMEKLIEIATMASSSEGTDRCEDCMEDKNESMSVSEVPFADKYCTDCQKKFCRGCSRYHLKNDLNKNHQVAAIADFKCKVQIVAPNNCIKHDRELDLYCSECKEPLCKSCFGESHQNHRLQGVRSTVEGFKNEIKDILSGLEMCISEVAEKKEALHCEVEEYCKHLESLKLEVRAQLRATIMLVSEHANFVIQDIEQLKVQKRKEVETEVEDRDGDLTCLESLRVFCTNVLTKRSASEICCTIDELKERFEDIKNIHELDIEMKTDLHRMSFQASDLEEFVKTANYNIIGTIQACQTDGEGEMKIANGNISHDGDIAMRENSGMAISCNNGILTKINRLKQELDDSQRRIDGLEMVRKSLEKRIDEFRVELGMVRPLKSISNWKLTQHAQASCKDLPSPRSSIDYKRTPHLLKRMESADAMFEETKIYRLAILGDELLIAGVIVSTEGSIVQVYDIKTLEFKRFWHVRRLLPQNSCRPRISCIASSTSDKCLYAGVYTICDSDCKKCFHQTVVQRTDLYGLNGKEWAIYSGTRISNLSVSGEGTVIVFTSTNHVIEYSSDGIVVHEIKLSLALGILYPLHALKLASGNFVISHGQRNNTLHEVLLLSKSGQVLRSFGEYQCKVKGVPQVGNPRVLNKPVYMAVDDAGNLLVVDRGNDRIVVLNGSLEFVSAIVSAEPLDKPRCMFVDTDRRQLFVCEGPRKIAVYDFCA